MKRYIAGERAFMRWWYRTVFLPLFYKHLNEELKKKMDSISGITKQSL